MAGSRGAPAGTLLRRSLLVALSAALAAASFPPLAWRGLAWVALVPLLVALRSAHWPARFAMGAAWSLLTGWGVGTWMPQAVANYFAQPLVVGWLSFLFVVALMAAPYYGLFAALYGPARRLGPLAPLAVGAAWAGAELLRGRLLNGDLLYLGSSPWATYGYSQAAFPIVVQVASLAGVYGVSFVLVAANAALAELWMARGRGWPTLGGALVASVVAALALGYGALCLRGTGAKPPDALRVAGVQAQLDAAERWNRNSAVDTLEAHLRPTVHLIREQRPAIVFWPEAALTVFLEQEALYRRALGRATAGTGTELVVGAPRLERTGKETVRNSLYLLAPGGEIRGRYDKEYLVPFMETFPVGINLVRRRFGEIREFSSGTGSDTAPLPTRAGAAGVLVCNEAMIPQIAAQRVREGAAYLFAPANEGWIPNAGYAELQFEMAVLRAVEQRRYLVRVSDQGPSAIVDPWGRVLARTEVLEPDVLIGPIAPRTERSLYARVGDAFGLCALAAALAGAAPAVRRRLSRRGGRAGGSCR